MREITRIVIAHTIRRPALVLADTRRSPIDQAVDDLMHGLMAARPLFTPAERRQLGAAVRLLRRAAGGG